ncbi:glycine oxidase ThiO [Alicyclobacillus acidiphilus]|uniref:glycine oxidase ThiO n=1 Tax=Alicyclobacillus acidiphilus TaxID=182455 RepID=UPI00146FEFCD|nr:glycine oxidase ThiO [Alicyclobacillus acidiphilus]
MTKSDRWKEMGTIASRDTTIVVGGGMIGCSVAFELLKAGKQVTLVERGTLFSEASSASAGMLCPQAEMLAAKTETIRNFYRVSGRIHREWTRSVEEVSGRPVDYRQDGMIRVFLDHDLADSQFQSIEDAHLLSELTKLSPDEVRSLEPSITEETVGGILFSGDGQLHPLRLAISLKSALARLGCRILEHTVAHELLHSGHDVIGVRTSEGDLFADTTVVAGGAWSSALLKTLELDVPVVPVKGQMYAVRSSNVKLTHVIQGFGTVVLPRLDGSFTVGVTHEMAGYDKRVTVAAIADVHKQLCRGIPEMKHAEFAASWAGLRPGTPDGLPYIGHVDGWDGLIAAAGHYTTGILLGPITGVAVRQLVLGEEPLVPLDEFRPLRAMQMA